MSENIKVLHVMGHYGGGIGSFIQNKAESMVGTPIDFDVCMYGDYPGDFESAIAGMRGSIFTLKNPKTEGFKAFHESFKKALTAKKYDIIYCHINGYRALAYYLWARKYSQAKFYVHAHLALLTKDLSKKEALEISFNQKINRSISEQPVGCGLLAIQSHYGSNISSDECVVIPNSIDLDTFIKDDDTRKNLRKEGRAKLGLRRDETVIGHIGRLKPVKNHEKTLDLASASRDLGLNHKYLLIGSGEREEELKNLVNERNLENQIIFTGRLSPIDEVYPILDLVLLPSYLEGLPTTIIESQAAGVPAVISDTTTDEVDLGLGLVYYQSLQTTDRAWLRRFQQALSQPIPKQSDRARVLEANKYSNDAAGQLYADFLIQEVSSVDK